VPNWATSSMPACASSVAYASSPPFFYYAVSDLIKYLMPLLNKNLCIPAVRDLLMSILFAPYSQKIIFITGNKRHSSDTLHFKVEDAK
jgi:hypothetical protein